MVQVEAIAASQKQLLQKPTCSWIRWVQNHLLLLLVLLAQPVLGGQIVKYLPGFDGELPFKLETGYISVDDSELFYYFIESEGNPQEDPLFLWLTGGPGCTSFSGLLYEVGPMEYDIDNYTGGLPKLKYYPYARTKTASMIFLDAPVGTGFSYARTPGGWPTSDTKSAEQSYQFLRKWLVEHPQFLSVQLFVGGDSYAGLTVPLITKKIIDGNKEKAKPYMNIKGYLVGCPGTDSVIDGNSRVDFAHRMALISDEIYENAKRSCNENYINVDPANTACITAMGAIQKCLKDLSDKDILKPKCDLSSQDHPEGPDRRFLKEGSSEFLLSPSTFPKPWCTTLKLTHNSIWANDDGVQEALHVRKGTVPRWERCNNSLSYTQDVLSVIAVHKELSRSSLEVLVESSELWQALSQMYAHAHNDACIFELHQDIARASQSSLGLFIAEFSGYLQALWEELAQYESLTNLPPETAPLVSKRLARQHTYQFLMGLDSEFESLRIQILNISLMPSLYEAFATIDSDERRRRLVQPSVPSIPPVLVDQMALVASFGSWSSSSSITCHHCGAPGHVKARCFKLHPELGQRHSRPHGPTTCGFGSARTTALMEVTPAFEPPNVPNLQQL
ncbi:hypothetical protein CsSME_00047889 [Camellia sinensis var. sinensis]